MQYKAMDNRIKSLFKDTAVFGVGMVGAKIIQFFLLPFYTNELNTYEYGTIELIMTLSGLIVPVITLQIADAVLRFGLSMQYKKSDIFHGVLYSLGIAVVLSIICIPGFYLIGSLRDYSLYISAIIILTCVRGEFANFVKSCSRNVLYSVDSMIYIIVSSLCSIILIRFYDKGVYGYLFGEISGLAGSSLFLFLGGGLYKEVKGVLHLDKRIYKEMIDYSWPLIFNGISWWIVSFSDRYILSFFYSNSEVGIYSVASKIPAIVTTALTMFTQAWILSAVKEFETERRPKLFQRIYDIFLMVVCCMTLGIIAIIKPFTQVYVGSDFVESWKYATILIIASGALGISNYFSALYAAAKLNKKEAKVTLLGAAINIVLNIVLIPVLSIEGAALATLASYIFMIGMRIFETRDVIKICYHPIFISINLCCLAADVLLAFSNLDKIMICVTAICVLIDLMFCRRFLVRGEVKQ